MIIIIIFDWKKEVYYYNDNWIFLKFLKIMIEERL